MGPNWNGTPSVIEKESALLYVLTPLAVRARTFQLYEWPQASVCGLPLDGVLMMVRHLAAQPKAWPGPPNPGMRP